MIELLSIDLSNFCSKQCSFCYNHSNIAGNVLWQPRELIAFAEDCIEHGIKAVSLGGGEPFEYDGIWEVIDALYTKCYLSVTSNGLPLENESVWTQLQQHKPDKIHLTIHNPNNRAEVQHVFARIPLLQSIGIKPGINLLVGADKVDDAQMVYADALKIVDRSQIIVIPQRFSNTPSAADLGRVAGNQPFQSPSCLLGCKRPTNFCSVSWDKKVNSCSYAPGKAELKTLDYVGLIEALGKIKWQCCEKK